MRDVYDLYPDAGVCFMKILLWGYLETDLECRTQSTWKTTVSGEETMSYYQEEKHPLPGVVFLLEPSVANYETAPLNNHLTQNDYNS